MKQVSPGQCGCGERDDDRDGDNVSDCIDDCPLDPNKVRILNHLLRTQSSRDFSWSQSLPTCSLVLIAVQVRPGVCGCGVEDIDTDGDLVLDCLDQCPNDPDKVRNVLLQRGVKRQNSFQVHLGEGVVCSLAFCGHTPRSERMGEVVCQECDNNKASGNARCEWVWQCGSK